MALIKEISIKWHIEDVQERAKEIEINLTDEQASDILQLMEKRHDCTIGINWETIDIITDIYLEIS